MEELSDKQNDQLKKHLSKLLSALHSDSHNVICKALSQLRADAAKYKMADKYLCELDAFKVLVKFLKLPNDKILNIALSILANSSLKEDARNQIGEAGVLSPLVSILKHITQDSIQNRACRLAANLALSKKITCELHEHKITPAIVNILKTPTASSCTLQSAIRALRILWDSSGDMGQIGMNIKDTMLVEGMVKFVAEKLTSESSDVVKAALKAIATFTLHSPSNCAHQLRLAEGNGFQTLISKLPNSTVIAIIYNLCKCRPGICHLNECHTVRSVIKLLADPVYGEQKILIDILCYLCEDCSGSMQLITTENGLNVFLCLLEQTQTYNIRTKLYHVLLRFIFEPHVLLRLTRLGLVKILINKLDQYVKKYGKAHKTAESELKEVSKWSFANVYQFINKNDSNYEFNRSSSLSSDSKYIRSFSSPGLSGTSPIPSGSASPSSSNPRSLSPTLSDEDDDDSPLAVYSPVCSINDEENESSNDDNNSLVTGDRNNYINSESDNEILSELVSYNEKNNDSPTLNDILKDDLGKSLTKGDSKDGVTTEGVCIVYILSKLSHIEDNVVDLASERTVRTLLQYIALVRNPGLHVISFFTSLVIKEQYYCELLDNQFALEVQRTLCRPIHAKCVRCYELKETGEYILKEGLKLSEAGLGEGQMAYRLLTGQDNVKLQVALTVPHVSRDPKLLMKLLFQYNAMDIIIKYLLTINDLSLSSIEDIAYGLKILFTKLNYKNPQSEEQQQNEGTSNENETSSAMNSLCIGCDVGKLRKESSITFRLDDGSIVPANKTSLCHNSPVFEAMLNGNFKESEQNEVKICDISEKCLQHFVKIIDTYCECILPSDVTVLLELISVSDRYLAITLMNNLVVYVMNYILSYKNCHIIYKWAKDCKLPFSEKISNDVIKYIFTSNISCKQLRKALSNMMNDLTYKDYFINDVINMIKDGLIRERKNNKSHVQNYLKNLVVKF